MAGLNRNSIQIKQVQVVVSRATGHAGFARRAKLRRTMSRPRHRTPRLFSCQVKSEGESPTQPSRSGSSASAAASIVDVICQHRAPPTGTPSENRSGPGTNILRRFVYSAEVRKSILESCSPLPLATIASPPVRRVRSLRLKIGLAFWFPQGPSGELHGTKPCRAPLRPSRESNSPHLCICALSVKSKPRENTGLISQRKHYSKNPIPSAARALYSEEFLPGEGKIFTVAARAGSSRRPHRHG